MRDRRHNAPHGPDDGLAASGARQGDDALLLPAGAPDGDPLPPVDERLATPETRTEYLGGGEMYAAPADEPHATEHGRLSYVLGAHVGLGYTCAVDMLTRTGHGSDIAPDASVFPSARDPVTGGRRLEELAFEVTSEQALRIPTEKARELVGRGVRRVFCVLVAQKRVLEWSRETAAWSTLPASAVIEDRCLTRPMPVRALLDASAADGAAAAALLEKHIPELEQALEEREGRGEARGEARGRAAGEARQAAAGVLAVLEARGIEIREADRRRIRETTDVAVLERWLRRAVIAASLDEVFRAG